MSRSITSRRRQLAVTAGSLLSAVLLAGVLAGCGTPGPELGSETARQLQSQVLAVSEAAAADNPAGSLKLLDALVTKLDQAAANGDVSFKRHQSIRAAIDAVRADLTAKQAAEAARLAAEQQAAAAAAAASTAPPPAVVAPAPAPADNSKAKGNGKSKGNG
ncbi:mucin-associated surface protein [Arthrobacter sp. PAMC25564]|uniref:mucin-associated surface protein n=1 Tax=Arthrobacter sp. PAMC25564 TaxID=2565366 RepID=UPI0010A28B0B|nr:mucin-associated surface protein [Arthrobacter sp. PAMC25564]QCB98527.1 mucin-associated surface protein [Arthrobacter sp. PAMC25564]